MLQRITIRGVIAVCLVLPSGCGGNGEHEAPAGCVTSGGMRSGVSARAKCDIIDKAKESMRYMLGMEGRTQSVSGLYDELPAPSESPAQPAPQDVAMANAMLDILRVGMADGEAEVRECAMSAAVEIGTSAARLRDDIGRRANDEDDGVRIWAGKAYYFVCNDEKRAVLTLCDAMKSGSNETKARAVYGLAQMRKAAAGASEALMDLMHSTRESGLRDLCQAALRAIK